MRRYFILLLAVACLQAAPRRIVSTAPSITETLFAMNLGARVVGVTVYCKYPPEVLKLPRIGTLLEPDIEAILALHPDLVVVEQEPNHLGDQLARLRVPFLEVQSDNLGQIYAGARAIGKAAQAEAEAEAFIGRMEAGLKSIQKRTEGHARPSAVFVVGHNPGSVTGLVVGSGSSYFSDLLNAAGGRNVFETATGPYPQVSLEDVLARDPDVIVELSGESRAKQEEAVALWRNERGLKAVRTGRVYAAPAGGFLIPGPRALEAAELLLRCLHPELGP